MNTVALLAPGLMGGSIGLAIRERQLPLRIQAYARRPETRAELLARGMADAVFDDPADAVRGADLVILCAPVRVLPALLAQARPGLRPGCVVTDVGSTKAWLQEQCREVLNESGAMFVGSHPMCGSEKTGLAPANAQLYQDAVCIVCADAASRSVVWQVSQFWTRLGARVVEMDADKHDALAAVTSHVPHLAASALVLATTGDAGSLRDLIGPGFRDTTRVAAGSASVWRDIAETNRPALSTGLRATAAQILRLADTLDAGNFDALETLLADAAARRTELCPCNAPQRAGEGVIAIDGPSASGKSTVARSLARKTKALYVDSGAMYRGMTWKVLREGGDPRVESVVRDIMERARWHFDVKEGAVRFRIDGEDPGEEIRGEDVRENVSYVARIPEVRSFIVERLRDMRRLGKLVVEGRDIGSVVFPDSPWKFYLDADPEERARRRNAELLATESGTSVESVLESLRKRDHLDSTRKTAPLQVADGAQIIDTTALNLEQVVQVIESKLQPPCPNVSCTENEIPA
jgi:cytidylate kinase